MDMKNWSFLSGLRHALDGVKELFRSERSMRIHVFVAGVVVLLGMLLQISAWEWVVCIILIGLVIGAELLNTAIEQAVDICLPHPDPRAKRAKDTAAGAVLIVASAAVVAGLIIFAPKVWFMFF
jgi:undecaprenol kinase